MENGGQKLDPEPKPFLLDPRVKEKEKEKETEFIYRSGAHSDKIYTPRLIDVDPSATVYDQPGMSCFTTPGLAVGIEGGKAQQLKVSYLRTLGFIVN